MDDKEVSIIFVVGGIFLIFTAGKMGFVIGLVFFLLGMLDFL